MVFDKSREAVLHFRTVSVIFAEQLHLLPVRESALGYPQRSVLSVFAEGHGLPWWPGMPAAV